MTSITSSKHSDYPRVPGANLYSEVRGTGLVLLMIHGAAATPAASTPWPSSWPNDYTIVAYDRRGPSRSKLDDPKAWSVRS